MPRCERRGLIQKKQFGVFTRVHHASLDALEGELAGNPRLALELPDDVSRTVMQAAAIAHQCSARGGGNDFPERGNAVLQWAHCF